MNWWNVKNRISEDGKTINCKCPVCKKEFTRYKSSIRSELVFCSRRCSTIYVNDRRMKNKLAMAMGAIAFFFFLALGYVKLFQVMTTGMTSFKMVFYFAGAVVSGLVIILFSNRNSEGKKDSF